MLKSQTSGKRKQQIYQYRSMVSNRQESPNLENQFQLLARHTVLSPTRLLNCLPCGTLYIQTLGPKVSFWDNFRLIIAGSKAVVVRTALPPVLDVKKLPVRPNRPDLRQSLSRTTFSWPKVSFWDNFRLIIAGSKAVVVRTALPPVLDVKKLPVRPNRPDLRQSLSRTTFSLCGMWRSSLYGRIFRI